MRIQDSTNGKVSETVGIFHAPFRLTLRQRRILNELTPFYNDAVIDSFLIPTLQQRSGVSLRNVDWLVTNYAKKANVVLKSTNQLFNVHNEYKTALSYFRRRNFDPFRRRMRVSFQHGGETHETTVGQLNFLRWARENGVLDFAEKNLSEIEADMQASSTANRSEERQLKRRRELSRAPSRRVSVYRMDHTISFA